MNSKKADIWMPLYIGDYLADTSRLTTEQHGAYLLLIMDYWRSGKPPDNDQVLAQICKLSPDAWSNAKAMLKQYFVIEDGFWIHKRIESEITSANENKDKRHERALKGAKARWDNATSNASSTQQAMLIECPSPSPSPSPLSTTDNKTTLSSKQDDRGFETFWEMYPKKVGKKAAQNAWRKIDSPITTLDLIREALLWQKLSEQWLKDNGQFIPNPQTYLNQGRWLDQKIEVTGNQSLTKLGQRAEVSASRWLNNFENNGELQ